MAGFFFRAADMPCHRKDAPRLPLNMLDALRAYDADPELKAMMGEAFSSAFLKLKHREWNQYVAHFTAWEKENALDV